jgi:hypothetical protein
MNTMKKITLLIAMLSAGLSLKAQILEPVKWSYGCKSTGPNEAVLFIKATIDDGWHIYSVNQKDGGPVKTSFAFVPSGDYTLNGKVTEPKPITKYEKSFGINVNYFARSVIFQQKIRLTGAKAVVKGSLNFMVCNDEKCLPPEDVDFSIPVE